MKDTRIYAIYDIFYKYFLIKITKQRIVVDCIFYIILY